jgi:hypothetical protein
MALRNIVLAGVRIPFTFIIIKYLYFIYYLLTRPGKRQSWPRHPHCRLLLAILRSDRLHPTWLLAHGALRRQNRRSKLRLY